MHPDLFDWFAVAAMVFSVAALVVLLARTSKRTSVPPAPEQNNPQRAPAAIRGEVPMTIVRRHADSVEGLEIQYGERSLVRAVRVGAMNCEHKELLLTMDAAQWNVMTNAAKQEVLAAARSTWAAKMCPSGPDIAYVVIQTDGGAIVGRADPSTVHVV